MYRNVLYQNPQSFLRTLDTVEKVEEMEKLCKEHKNYLLNKVLVELAFFILLKIYTVVKKYSYILYF